MSTGVVPDEPEQAVPSRRVRGLLPEPPPRTGAHGFAGKRVREDVREGVAVILFSVSTALLIALAVTALARVAG